MSDFGNKCLATNSKQLTIWPLVYHSPDHLMPGNNWEFGRWCSAFDFIKFGVTNAAANHAKQYIVTLGCWRVQLP